jgi:hypothetical protein
MASLVLNGNTSGSVTISSPAVSGTTTLTLPATSGTVVTTGNIPTGSVLQVLQTSKTDTFSSSSASWVDVTGLSVTITPSSSSNKILVTGVMVLGQDAGNLWGARLLRNGTLINAGDASGSIGRGLMNAGSTGIHSENPVAFTFLDSPATTSACTYKLQVYAESGYAVWVNRTSGNLNDDRQQRTSSNIIVMEIKG